MDIARTAILETIRAALARNPVTVLSGPRQAGKTTLARELLAEDSPNYFDLSSRRRSMCATAVCYTLETEKALLSHPKLGASWEGFVIEQILASEPFDEAWFWATHQGAEMDLLLRRGDRLLGIECKRSDAPKITQSIRIAIDDLGLERVAVIYPGTKRYPLGHSVEAVPLSTLATPGVLFGAEVAGA
ncbi:MAG: DUF4143 domain-containing protein [Dehalococcoidia bacterium]